VLSRQQIRERKRHLQKAEQQKKDNRESLAELNEAERLLDQKRNTRDQTILQRGSLCVAIISQIPEHRPGVAPLVGKAVNFLDLMLDQGITLLTETDDDDLDDPDEDEDEDEPLQAVS
jgi:hypothetical protein